MPTLGLLGFDCKILIITLENMCLKFMVLIAYGLPFLDPTPNDTHIKYQPDSK